MQHPPFPWTRLPLHDQREFASRLLSLVFLAAHPSGLHPKPDVLSSNAVAATDTVVRSAASTSAGAAVGAVVVAGGGGGGGCGRGRFLR